MESPTTYVTMRRSSPEIATRKIENDNGPCRYLRPLWPWRGGIYVTYSGREV